MSQVEEYRARRAERNRKSYSLRGEGVLGDDPVENALALLDQVEEAKKIAADAEAYEATRAKQVAAAKADAAATLPETSAVYEAKRKEVHDALAVLERACVGLQELRTAYDAAWWRVEKYDDLDLPERIPPMAVVESVRFISTAVARG